MKKNIALAFCLHILLIPKIIAQCPHDALYYKGMFYAIHYNADYSKSSISKTGYTSFKGLTKEKIDVLSEKDSYLFNRYSKDSIGICSLDFQLFFDGLKCAVFQNGIKLTDFKYDNAYPFISKQSEKNKEKKYILVQIGADWGLLNEFGKELTSIAYKLPEINEGYASQDSIIFTCNKLTAKKDSAKAWEGKTISYPLTGPLIIFTKDNKVGAIDTLGNQAIPFVYDTIFCSNSGCLKVSKAEKQCYITFKGQELLGYDAVVPVWLYTTTTYAVKKIFSGIYMVKKDGKWGVVNSLNNTKIKCIFTIDSGDEIFTATSNTYVDGFLYNKKLYPFEVKKNEFILQDNEGKNVIQNFIEK